MHVGDEIALHHHKIKPPAKLGADLWQSANLAEAKGTVEPQRRDIARLDTCHHYMPSERDAAIYESLHQDAAYALQSPSTPGFTA